MKCQVFSDCLHWWFKLDNTALFCGLPEVRPVSTKPDASDKVASQKGKWLAGLINVVKSPIKNHSDSKGNNKSIHDVASASDKAVGTANKVKTKESNTGRSSGAKRDTPRSGLRLERRTLSNSSLDTVSTCLSQEDSFNNPYHQNKRMNMRWTNSSIKLICVTTWISYIFFKI